VKTNDEMAQVRALIASLLAEKAGILLRIERAAAGVAAALKDNTDTVLATTKFGRSLTQSHGSSG
jgi:hypothetical protein